MILSLMPMDTKAVRAGGDIQSVTAAKGQSWLRSPSPIRPVRRRNANIIHSTNPVSLDECGFCSAARCVATQIKKPQSSCGIVFNCCLITAALTNHSIHQSGGCCCCEVSCELS